MNVTVNSNGKIEFNLDELVSSLPDEQRQEFYQHLAFEGSLMTAVVETAMTGRCFDGAWYTTGLADKLRLKLVEAMPDAYRELVKSLVEQRDSAKKEAANRRELLYRLERHWPREAQPNECNSYRPEDCRCAWNQKQVEDLLVQELGENWKQGLDQQPVAETAQAS